MNKQESKGRLFFWYLIFWILCIVTLYLAYGVYFVDVTSTKSKWLGLFAGAICTFGCVCKFLEVYLLQYKQKENLQKIKQSLYFWLNKNLILSLCALIMCAGIFALLNINFAICFIVGFVIVSISNLIQSAINILGDFRDTNSQNTLLRLNYNAITSSSLFNFALLLIGYTILYHIYKDYHTLAAYIFGAMFYTLDCNFSFAIAEELKTKAQNFYEKLNTNLGEKFFALNMESAYSGIIFLILLGVSVTLGANCLNLMGAFLPIVLLSGGLFISLVISILVKLSKNNSTLNTLFRFALIADILYILVSYLVIRFWLSDYMELFYIVLMGAIFGYVSIFLNRNIAKCDLKPAKRIANRALDNTLSLFSEVVYQGMKSSLLPMVVFSLATGYIFLYCSGVESPVAGYFGVSLFSLSMGGIVLFYSIIYNFSISTDEIYKSNQQPRQTFCGISYMKNYFNILAVFSAIGLLTSYCFEAQTEDAEAINPYVLASFIFGIFTVFSSVMYALKSSFVIARRFINQDRSIRMFGRFASLCNFILSVYILGIIFIVSQIFDKDAFVGFGAGVFICAFVVVLFSTNIHTLTKASVQYFRQNYTDYDTTQEYTKLLSINEITKVFDEKIRPAALGVLGYTLVAIYLFYPLFK